MRKYFVFNLFLFLLFFGSNTLADKVSNIELSMSIEPVDFEVDFGENLEEIKISSPSEINEWSINIKGGEILNLPGKDDFYVLAGSAPSSFEMNGGEDRGIFNLITAKDSQGLYIINNLKVKDKSEDVNVYLTIN